MWWLIKKIPSFFCFAVIFFVPTTLGVKIRKKTQQGQVVYKLKIVNSIT